MVGAVRHIQRMRPRIEGEQIQIGLSGSRIGPIRYRDYLDRHKRRGGLSESGNEAADAEDEPCGTTDRFAFFHVFLHSPKRASLWEVLVEDANHITTRRRIVF